MSEGILQKYYNLDRRYIYLLTIILCSIPIVKPLGFPILISEETRVFQHQIDLLNPGDCVLMFFSFARTDYPELGYPMLAAFRTLLSRDMKVLIASTTVTMPKIIQNDIERIARITESESGVDFMNYGWIPGGEAAVAALAEDLRTVPVDFYGEPISEMPILENKNNIEDVQLVIISQSSADFPPQVVRQIYIPYGVKLIDMSTAGIYPTIAAYVEAGQIAGVIKGGRAAAEYEQIVGLPGRSTASIDCQVLVQGGFLCLGIINIIVDLMKKQPRKEGEN